VHGGFWLSNLNFGDWNSGDGGRRRRGEFFSRLKFWKASNFWRAAPISFEKARFLGGCRILEGAVGFEKTGFFFHPQQIRAQGEG
jgi:hypothetical protein